MQAPFRRRPVRLICPSCNSSIVSVVKFSPNIYTHVLAICFFIALPFICGCCIPYFVKQCQGAEHYCPQCGAYLGGTD